MYNLQSWAKMFFISEKLQQRPDRLFYGYNNGGKSLLANAKPFPVWYNVMLLIQFETLQLHTYYCKNT